MIQSDQGFVNSGEDEPRPFPVERSSWYANALAERREIDKLKWIESEKAGHDIGIYRAIWIWQTTHRARWMEQQRKGAG